MRNHIFAAATAVMSCTAVASPLMYVPTGGANDLVIIDLASDKIVGRIPELENAHGLAASPNSEYLVAGSMKPADPDGAGEAVKPEALSEDEHAAHHGEAPAGDPSAGATSYVSIVHPKHGHVMRRIAVRGLTHHTAVSPDGRSAVAVHSGAGGISVIDLENMQVVREVATGKSPNYGVFSADGRFFYVSNGFSGTVSEIRTGDWTVTRTLEVGREPEHMVLAPDGATLFVANVADGQVAAVDLGTGSVSARYDVGARPHGVDVSDDGQRLYASSQGDGKLVAVDRETGAQRSVELQPAPYHLEHVGSAGKLYVSSRKDPKIWVVDPGSLEVVAEIAIGEGVAHQMVVKD